MSITTLVKVIQDIMRKDVGVDGDAQRISQMVWMLFLKIFGSFFKSVGEWFSTHGIAGVEPRWHRGS